MFQSGQSGNPVGGPPNAKVFNETLRRAIKQEDGKRVRECVEKLLDRAAVGEPWAVQMLADRLDGKPHQAITGVDGGPLVVEIVKFSGDNHEREERKDQESKT
jgi:hypothetical protein